MDDVKSANVLLTLPGLRGSLSDLGNCVRFGDTPRDTNKAPNQASGQRDLRARRTAGYIAPEASKVNAYFSL